MNVNEHDRVTHIEFTGLKERTALPTLQRIPYQANPARFALDRLLAKHFGPLDDAAAAAAKDATLSDIGRAEKVAPYRKAAQAAIDETRAGFLQSRAAIERERAKLFVPPPPEDATMEGEIRQRWPTLTKAQRDAKLLEMRDGRNDVALHALLRDPLASGPDIEIIKSIWNPRVLREHKAALESLDATAEEFGNALAALGGLQRVLEKSAVEVPVSLKTPDVTY